MAESKHYENDWRYQLGVRALRVLTISLLAGIYMAIRAETFNANEWEQIGVVVGLTSGREALFP
jgi:outer membrane protease